MTKFMKVKCECKNEQVVFSKPSTIVYCVICNEPLVLPQGSVGNVKGNVVEVYE